MLHKMNLQERIYEATTKRPELNSSDLGRMFNCHPAYVRTVWQRYGLPSRKRFSRVRILEAAFRELLVALANNDIGAIKRAEMHGRELIDVNAGQAA